MMFFLFSLTLTNLSINIFIVKLWRLVAKLLQNKVFREWPHQNGRQPMLSKREKMAALTRLYAIFVHNRDIYHLSRYTISGVKVQNNVSAHLLSVQIRCFALSPSISPFSFNIKLFLMICTHKFSQITCKHILGPKFVLWLAVSELLPKMWPSPLNYIIGYFFSEKYFLNNHNIILMKKKGYHHMILSGGDCWSGKAEQLKQITPLWILEEKIYLKNNHIIN